MSARCTAGRNACPTWKARNSRHGAQQRETLMKLICLMVLVPVLWAAAASAPTRIVPVQVDLNDRLGPLEIDRFALGEGGLSDEPRKTPENTRK